MNDVFRHPHAALNPAGRMPKAEKIFRLLDLVVPQGRALRILEIGTGSGMIAYSFAQKFGRKAVVDAVDVVDQRVMRDGYGFQLVDSVLLPFEDGTFDAVITNHVIEHVGSQADQIMHLREISRVLRDDGKGYLAVPSRWQVVEPHYHLAFLSWLPRSWRSHYLRISGRGRDYDCEPLVMSQIESYLHAVELRYRNIFSLAMRALADTERNPPLTTRWMAGMPAPFLYSLRRFSPTHIYLFARQSGVLRHE